MLDDLNSNQQTLNQSDRRLAHFEINLLMLYYKIYYFVGPKV